MNVEEDPVVMQKAKLEKQRKQEQIDSFVQEERRLSKSSDAKNLHVRDQKRRFAISLATLASKADKREGIVADGAIVTLVKLSKMSDRQTQLSCASAFNSLASEPGIRKRMLVEGAVSAIVLLSASPLRKIKNDCARALCNLSAHSGTEEELVRQNCVPALLSMATSSIQLMEVVLTSCLNLSCTKLRYARIDEVNDAVIHLSGFSMNVKMERMLVGAICNLTALKNNQARLVEEGVVRELIRISKLAPIATQRLCATSFCNLASCSRSRSKMTDQRVIPTLLDMVAGCQNEEGRQDEEIKRQCANTVSRLSMDVACREKVVAQGAVAAIVEMSLYNNPDDPKSVETDRVCAAALNVLSADGDSSERLIKEGAIPALLALISREDKHVKTDCAHCLCVLFQFENGIDEMIDKGAVSALVKLADPKEPSTSGNCALALYNLLSHEVASKLSGEGILQALVNLSHAEDLGTKTTCAAALWELTTLSNSDPTKLIPALIKMLREEENSQIKGDCAAALYNLAQDMENCQIMMLNNCLEPLLSLVDSDNFGTRVQCGAILSRLSFNKANRKLMANEAFIDALFKLAECEPPSEEAAADTLMTQQRIVNAMYNISSYPQSRPLLLSRGAASFLTNFQTRPLEAIRRGCAAALCNLLVDKGTELDVLDVNGVSALLITALVASDKFETKKICTKCLFNLLSEPACHDRMVKEGVLWGFAALCKGSDGGIVEDVEMSRMCSQAFCNLTGTYAKDIIGSTACIKTLFLLTGEEDPYSRAYATRGLLNILSQLTEGVKEEEMVACSSVKPLLHLCSCQDPDVRGLCILAFCVISQFKDAREEMRSLLVLREVDINIVLGDPELSYSYAVTMCNMLADGVNAEVIGGGVIGNLMELSRSTEHRTVMVVARAIYQCTCDVKHITDIVKIGAVEAVQELLLSEVEGGGDDKYELHKFLSCSLFNMSTASDCHLDIVNKDAIQLVRVLWESGDEDVKRICALTTANLSCGQVNSAKIVGQQGTGMIAGLALEPQLAEMDAMWCVAALRNLLSTSANHRPMLKEGVVDALVKLADSKSSFVALNATASLRTMTYNVATREALISKNAISVIIDDTNAGDADDDLQIGSSLLQKIEAESWANGSRGIQREGRAKELDRQPLMMGVGDEAGAVTVEVPMLEAGWNKVECDTDMEEPKLERKMKKKDDSSGKVVHGGGGDALEPNQPEVEVVMVTCICPKIECPVTLNSSLQVQDTSKQVSKDEESFLASIEGKKEEPAMPQAEGPTADALRTRRMSGTGIMGETGEGDEDNKIDGLVAQMGGGHLGSEKDDGALVLPSILLTPAAGEGGDTIFFPNDAMPSSTASSGSPTNMTIGIKIEDGSGGMDMEKIEGEKPKMMRRKSSKKKRMSSHQAALKKTMGETPTQESYRDLTSALDRFK
ncbi:hypothetical protein TrLO_g12999 [Triparma laevis f. longispina]|uniref:Uncharacterized protein n=1 Tax=Triparma laevis f. longispina TaxID=1714387 RepID=A0A9W7FI32_9STRA|nr:hypothetical protein TrLO_g12999 [Triparma laevis f. longispina]